ncbi:phosphoenolpyruvate carboxylase type 1 [Dongia mobilis]|uniref:Phosphoenolpyruvate carboxylase n=1 Tax=Dongia mobilis TaxID=578943 RepID=A0A4V3DDP4_9PROT|nr:phosphoenolpyruvate carboxylase [Dongia mobilis]TDQ77532.1 phosphoenolpyruvate carboxylase type 1 [Dongia mobilis]
MAGRAGKAGENALALRVKANQRKPDNGRARKAPLEPGLKPLPRMFPLDAKFDAARAERELTSVFSDLASLRERNPFGNSVKLLALEVGKRLERGGLSLGGVETLIQELTAGAFRHRAQRLAAYLGECDPARNEQRLRAAFHALAAGSRRPQGGKGGKSQKISFASFKAAVERELFGIVITAHPTFSQSHEMVRLLAELGMGRDAGGGRLAPARRRKIEADIRGVEHRPPQPLDLAYEHDMSVAAIANIQDAIRRAYEIALEVAAECYPGEWENLAPRLVTVASWVGYDLDGRSDIKWSDTLFKRLKIQVLQLRRYMRAVESLRAGLGGRKGKGEIQNLLELLESRLALAVKEAEDEIDVFQNGRKEGESPSAWAEEVRRIAKRMHDGRELRLIDSAHLLELIERALSLCEKPEHRRQLIILRAEIGNHGLGMAHTHVRLNAVQIHNAIRKLINMETAPDDPARKRSYMAALARLLKDVKPVQINFASILAERTSAKRLFMIVAKMLKYIDANVPVRFLIAETESPLTLLAALYFAKLFGVADKVDISPLFETTKAFERGVRVIDECLQNPTYAAYVRARGRLCIQTGFSDAGRHLGQTVAAISVEWLRLKLAELMRQRGFDDIELVIFDTHGESIGRGGHPENFQARLEYIASPVSRQHFAQSGIRVKEEASFQGGDGYLYFITPDIALASVARILEYMLPIPTENVESDPAYRQDEDYIKEFFITIRRFNEEVMDDTAYAALLDTFGGNLLFVGGSRPVKREHEGLAQRVNLTHPTQMRAIPHNGILQQLGFFANTLGGVGQAIARDPERFQRLYQSSPRCRRLLGMVDWALAFTDLEAFKCYVDLFDPGQWLSRAYQAKDAERAAELRHVAEHLEEERIYEQLARIYRTFQRDMLDLREGLALVGLPTPKIDEAARQNLRLMHGLRIALIMRIFTLSAHVPDFSDQHNITRAQLISKIFHLEIDDAMRKLMSIFPKVEQTRFEGDFGETATYVGDWSQTYEREHQVIFGPIAGLYTLVRRLSSGIIHTIGAMG